MHSAQTPADAARWAELVAALSGHVEDMAADFVQRVAQIPDYAQDIVPPADLARTAALTFAMLVDALKVGAEEADARMLEYAADLGAKRARAGIPPSSLTSAVRLDFSIIWGQLLALARAHDGALLASRAVQVWRVVDDYALKTQESYQAERVRMAQEESSVQREFLAMLFGPEQLSAESLARIGSALRLPPDARLALAAATGPAAAPVRALGDRVSVGPSRHPSTVHVYESGGAVLAFWREPRPEASLPDGLADLPIGLVRGVRGLAALRPAGVQATALAAEAREGDAAPLELGGAWHRVARRVLEDAGMPVGAAIDEALSVCRDSERERLVETVRSFLVTGSVTATAGELFCHRNTILNRLARFHELTGLDVTVPAQAARVYVAWA